jgi:arylsulfatase A-like enzyme
MPLRYPAPDAANSGGRLPPSSVHEPEGAKVTMTDRPNILILCMDQWDVHMELPEGVELPAIDRLQELGVTFDRHYCTVPICTPSRASMWTGLHPKRTPLWDNTNFAWIRDLPAGHPTIGSMMREQGYYTAFKGKWHLSEEMPQSEDALEPYGFSDFQQWGDMFGTPLQGAMLDGAAAFETVDWLRHKRRADQPWLLISSLVNPHDIMYLRTAPEEQPHPNGAMARALHHAQTLGFMRDFDVALPGNFDDDLEQQPYGVHSYKRNIEWNYGKIPEGRDDLWKARRRYLVNCLRMVDLQFSTILDEMDAQGLWDSTVVIFTSDHGEMNGAHRMAQKGAIHFDEAAVVNLTVVVPGGPQGARTAAVGSHLDLAPTVLALAGVDAEERARRYPDLAGRDLSGLFTAPEGHGPRGSARQPGDGALITWDGLNMLDPEWAIQGAMRDLLDLPPDPDLRDRAMREVGERFGAPDFTKRTFYRAVVDGRHKLVRWFSPVEYEAPRDVEELYARSDVTLHDLVDDPGELENLGHPDHPRHDPQLVARMLAKLNALIERELGDDERPFDLDMFGTRDVTYRCDEQG